MSSNSSKTITGSATCAVQRLMLQGRQISSTHVRLGCLYGLSSLSYSMRKHWAVRRMDGRMCCV